MWQRGTGGNNIEVKWTIAGHNNWYPLEMTQELRDSLTVMKIHFTIRHKINLQVLIKKAATWLRADWVPHSVNNSTQVTHEHHGSIPQLPTYNTSSDLWHRRSGFQFFPAKTNSGNNCERNNQTTHPLWYTLLDYIIDIKKDVYMKKISDIKKVCDIKNKVVTWKDRSVNRNRWYSIG